MNRNKLSGTLKKWVDIGKMSRKRIQQRYKREVVSFMERDDSSRAQPGKADVKKSEGEKRQTRVLTDYLSNLHDKFQSEHPEIKLSLATFCRMRPRHILTTSLILRSSCLCTTHQNMALLLKALKKYGISVQLNPESFLKSENPENALLREILPDEIAHSHWKRIEVTEIGKMKKVMRIVESKNTRE